jgi:hypothetical protein
MSAIEAQDGIERLASPLCDARPPLALRGIAYLFILGGVLGITEMIVQLVCSRGLIFDIGWLIWILTGRGLLRWRNGWRRWAVFCGWLALLVAALTVAFALWDMCFGLRRVTYPRLPIIRRGPLSGIVAGTLLGLGAWWVIHILRRPDIVERFRSPPALPVRRPWQFSLGTLMVAMVFVAFVVARVCSDDVKYRVEPLRSNSAVRPDGTVVGWTYGTRTSRFWDLPPELWYAILHGNSSGVGVGRSAFGKITFEWLDGVPIDVSGGNQLFEVVDGRIVPREGRVSLEEFEDFVRQSRPDWSVEGLLEHARQMREKAKVEAAK